MGDNSALAGVPSPTSVEPLKLVAVDKKGHSWVNDIKELQSNEPFREVCLGRVVALWHTLVSIQCVDGWNHDLFHTLVVIQFGVSWNHDSIYMKWIKLSLQHRK